MLQSMYDTCSVILNIRHQEQYGGQMQMEKNWGFCSGSGTTWQSDAGGFCPLSHIETSAVIHILPPGG